MAQAKIQFALGSISFSGEGEEEWIAKQLDKVLEKAPDLLSLLPEQEPNGEEQGDASPKRKKKGSPAGTLASFLTTAGATSNQVKRFLATAEWLHRKDKEHLTTAEVRRALQDNHQKRLGNPADSLSKNVSKGYCEKVGKQFYVTPEGRTSLGSAASK